MYNNKGKYNFKYSLSYAVWLGKAKYSINGRQVCYFLYQDKK